MFNWFSESKIQNVSKAIHERTNKIISLNHTKSVLMNNFKY